MSELLVLLFLILINAFFAMSEIALVQSSKPLLRQMAKQGNKRAALALEMAEDTGRSLSTIQVGITLIGILAGAYGGATIAGNLTPFIEAIPFINQWAHQIALFIAVLFITYLSVVIGELVPKQLALVRPEKLAITAAYPMTLVEKVSRPLVWLLDISAAVLLKILGVNVDEKVNITEDEVKAVLFEGAESGALDQNEYAMLRRIIALDDREVKTIMTPRIDIVSIDIDDDIDTIRRTICESGHSRFPVIDGSMDNLKGVVTAREVLEVALSKDKPFHLGDLLQPASLLSDNVTCHKALELFKNFPVKLAMVIDEYGTVEGIVTAADVLEAIVGSVVSNYEDSEPSIIARADGISWLVDGLTPVDEIVLTLDIEGLDDNDTFTTLAGFVLHGMEKSPETGDTLDAYGYRFEIVDMDGRRIDKVLISKQPDASETDSSGPSPVEIA